MDQHRVGETCCSDLYVEGRERERERDRETERETETERERDRQTDRERQTERERDRQRETDRERERERVSERESMLWAIVQGKECQMRPQPPREAVGDGRDEETECPFVEKNGLHTPMLSSCEFVYDHQERSVCCARGINGCRNFEEQ